MLKSFLAAVVVAGVGGGAFWIFNQIQPDALSIKASVSKPKNVPTKATAKAAIKTKPVIAITQSVPAKVTAKAVIRTKPVPVITKSVSVKMVIKAKSVLATTKPVSAKVTAKTAVTESPVTPVSKNKSLENKATVHQSASVKASTKTTSSKNKLTIPPIQKKKIVPINPDEVFIHSDSTDTIS